jgi:hypothetical protein
VLLAELSTRIQLKAEGQVMSWSSLVPHA